MGAALCKAEYVRGSLPVGKAPQGRGLPVFSFLIFPQPVSACSFVSFIWTALFGKLPIDRHLKNVIPPRQQPGAGMAFSFCPEGKGQRP